MLKFLSQLIRPHPEEIEQGIWFQEEARAERIANLMRIGYLLFWLPSVIAIAPAHPLTANIANIGLSTLWLLGAVGYHLYLLRQPYRASYKYLSTLVDMVIITAVLFLYHYDMGYSTTLKAPPFINYLAVLMLAALRFNVRFPIYTGVLGFLAYSSLLAFMILTQPVEFGTPLELFTTPRINFVYQLINLQYIAAFTLAGFVLVLNVRRLVRLRVDEAERALAEKVEREKTQDLLERYFTPEIARYLAEHPPEMGGASQPATVLMCDLRGFTAYSERIGPAESVRLLNKLFERLVAVVFKYEGTLDKFLGDGMLVIFGTPSPRDDDAYRAVQAGREMLAVMAEKQSELPLALGVAIHSGEVIFGNVGSPQRMELTIIGDVVNTVSRMEALNKEFGTNLILSETTYRQMPGGMKVRELPARELRGKAESIRLYTLDS
jgi:adenylate cyclase